jgi:hypothetical protein
MALSILALSAIGAGDEAAARQWLTRIANQPRVQPQYRQRLLAGYREAFGRDWAPEKPVR